MAVANLVKAIPLPMICIADLQQRKWWKIQLLIEIFILLL